MIWSLCGPNGSQLVEATVWLKARARFRPIYELGKTVNRVKAKTRTSDKMEDRIYLKILWIVDSVRI